MNEDVGREKGPVRITIQLGRPNWVNFMHDYKGSLFRIFRSDVRSALQRFFENRHAPVTLEIARELIDANTLDKLIGLQLVEHDNDEYRLDDRVERFLDEMLGVGEVAQADWLVSLLEDLRRLIDGYPAPCAGLGGSP